MGGLVLRIGGGLWCWIVIIFADLLTVFRGRNICPERTGLRMRRDRFASYALTHRPIMHFPSDR